MAIFTTESVATVLLFCTYECLFEPEN